MPDRRSDDAAVDGRDRVASGPAPRQPGAGAPPGTPVWFEEFVIDRATGKPSVHTVKAYRQDFAAIAAVLTGGRPAELALADITRESMRAAFAAYAPSHEPASIRRCWSTWNVLCDFLYTAELIAANPMPLVGRPKPAKTLPKALPQPAVAALIAALEADRDSPRATAWFERDLALILTALLAGLRADELRRADVGDIRTATGGGAVIGVRGKGSKDRSVPIEADLLSVIEDYLDSRARRLPTTKILGGTGAVPLAGERAAVRGPRRRTDHPRRAAVAGPPRVPARGPRRPAGARCPRARAAPHLRHRAGQLRGQRVYPDETPGPRVDGDITALRRRRRPRNPHRRRAKPALRNDSRSAPSVAHG